MSTNRGLAVEITADSSNYRSALEQATRATETNAKRMQTSLQQVGGGNSKAVFQNLGYQINDVAAQVSAGGNVIQAAGMQVGQFLQMFGPWGAIIGAAVAVGGSLTATMLKGEDATKAATKAAKAEANAVEMAQKVMEANTESVKRHNEEKRKQAIVTREATKETRKETVATLEAEIAALEKLRKLGDFDSAGAGDQSSTFVQAGIQLESLKKSLAEAQDALKDTNEELDNLRNPSAEWNKGGKSAADKASDDYARMARDLKMQTEALDGTKKEQFVMTQLRQLDANASDAQRASVRALAEAFYEEKKARDGTNLAIQQATELATKDDQARTDSHKNAQGVIADMRELNQSLDEQEASAKRELDASKLGNRERQVEIDLLKEQQKWREKGIPLTEQELDQKREQIGRIVDMKTAAGSAEAAAKDLGLTFTSAFEDAIVKGAKFSDVLQGIEADIARIILRQAVTKPLADAVGGINWGAMASSAGDAAGGAGSWFSGLFGGLSGARAAGGPVNAGGAYLVGENGPEIMVPSAPGSVIPNHKLGGLGGGSTTVVNQTLQISTGVAATVQAELRNSLPMIASVTKAAIANDQARKGRSL